MDQSPNQPTSQPANQTTLAIIGAGTMGSGIALAALTAGFPVILQDTFPAALERARGYLAEFLAKKGMADRLHRVTFTSDLASLAPADIVIEAALEDLALKREIFAQLETICRPAAILASNTSTLSVTAIAAAVSRPERVAGMHFFNPAAVLKLVEIVQGLATSRETIQTLETLATHMGKTPVVTRDTPGFIVNRVARPYYGEALRLLGEGVASHEQIDLALELGAGFRMGPFRLMDLIGIDINATAMQSMYEQTFGEPRYRPHVIQMQMMSSGSLGRKTGQGFYDYRGGGDTPKTEPPPVEPGNSTPVWFAGGAWACGLDALLAASGFTLVKDAPPGAATAAAFMVDAAADMSLHNLDWWLPPDTPIFVQCLDATLHARFGGEAPASRMVGFDPLLLASGRVATLIEHDRLGPAIKQRAEDFVRALGRIPLWIPDSPGLILPRVLGMLINEAVFAVSEGVADPEKVDLAMKLGVNYPRGLIEWGREIGWARLVAILDHLQREYGEDRYRPCALMRRWARQP